MNLRSKLAVAFAGVGAAVAILVGVFSYQAASQRINAELDRSLLTTSAEIAAGATQVLAPSPVTRGPDDDDHDEAQSMVAQAIAPDGTTRPLGGRPVRLAAGDDDRALAATGVLGDHRSMSSDSRDFGPIDQSYVTGKAVFVYWPVDKLGTLR